MNGPHFISDHQLVPYPSTTMLARVLSWVNMPSAASDRDPLDSHLNLLDLPFDVLETIMTYALARPPPSSAAAVTPQTSNRADCLRTCKAFNSAGEKELFRFFTLSTQASWVALFGRQTGLLTIDSTRDVARFVQEVTIGRDPDWDWGTPRGKGEAGKSVRSLFGP
jgi:hypothetical protein